MPTFVLNVYTTAYPFITNRLRASVFLQSDPQALISQQYDSISGHPRRTWSFPGLPKNNYGFSLDEVNVSNVVVSNLAYFDVVPGERDGLLHRSDEQIKVDTTTGFTNGLNTFTFDGTNGTPNYKGWDIVPSELTGRGILVRGVDYSWDSTLAKFTLLRQGDVFTSETFYNIHFEDQISAMPDSTPTILDFKIEIITASRSIDSSFFGKKLIIEPSGNYVEITLPPLSTVPQGRKLMVEISSPNFCSVRFITTSGEPIRFARGNLYALPHERFSIYRAIRSGVTPNEYRVDDTFGNFLTRGTIVGDDAIASDIFTRHLFDGSSEDIYQYARIYFDYVKVLPLSQVVNYDDWGIGNNKYLYSLANSSNPANLNKFYFPDRRGLWEMNNVYGKAGDYFEQQILAHTHPAGTAKFKKGSFGNGSYHAVSYGPGNEGDAPFTEAEITGSTGGTVNRPNSYSINRYVLI